MNRIESLIAELCPDGVEYKTLGEVAELTRGTSITKKNVVEGSIPVVAGGRIPAYYHNEHNRVGETIVVAGSGAYAGFVSWWEDPIFVSDAFSIKTQENALLPKYCYYWLTRIQNKIHSLKKGSGVPHVYAKDVAKFEIPVPPLQVQEAIVEILDKFQALEAELEAELEARKKQYEYYRDQLLSFPENGGGESVRWMTLSELVTPISGLRGKTKADFSEGNKRFISYKNIFNNISVDQFAEDYVKVQQSENQNSVDLGDILITGSSESTEELGMTSVVTTAPREDIYVNSFCFILRPIDKKLLDPRFSKFLFRSSLIRDQIKKAGSGVTRINISKPRLLRIQIPVPPLEEQQRIVDILDKFDVLVNDLTAGLPAEIEARRKQYEYYRDQLLTFKELA